MHAFNMPTSATILSTLSLLPIALAHGGSGPYDRVPARLPPYLSNTSSSSSNSAWPAPPIEFYGATWYMTNASLPSYQALPNLQWDLWLAKPSCAANSSSSCPPDTVAGQMTDITTWAIASNSSNPYDFGALGAGDRPCASFVGHHTPRLVNDPALDPAVWGGVFDVRGLDGAMTGYENQWSVLWWGEDRLGFDFMVLHEDAATQNGEASQDPTVDVVSRSPRGADPESLGKVLDELVALGNEDVSALVEGFGAVEWDYGLDGGPAVCPESCLKNKVL